MNEHLNDITNEDLIAAARGRLSNDRAVGQIMLAVREASSEAGDTPARRWDRAAALAFAAAGIAVLTAVVAREWLTMKRVNPAPAERPMVAEAPTTLVLPNHLRVAMTEGDSALLQGKTAIQLDHPMRLSVVQGALRVEPNSSGTTPPGR